MSTERDVATQQSVTAHELSKASNNDPAALPAVVEQVLGSLGGKCFHNFGVDKLDVWRQTAIATGPDVKPVSGCLGNVIPLHKFYCHQVQIAGETPGEYLDAIRVVLIDDDDNAYACVSDGVARDLGRIIATFGMGPYDPPIGIRVVQGNTRKGRRFYSLQPA